MTRYDPWERLLAESGAAVAETRGTVLGCLRGRVAGLGRVASGAVMLRSRDADTALGGFLSDIEDEARGLCDRYDYRQLFLFSRLCVNLPVLRTAAPSVFHTQMRGVTADLWALRFGGRLLGDFFRADRGGYSFGRPPEGIERDAAKLHLLAISYRQAVSDLGRLSYLRLLSGEAQTPGPGVRFFGDGRFGVVPGSGKAAVASELFAYRRLHSTPLGLWGVGGFEPEKGYPLTLVYYYAKDVEDAPYGGTPFIPRPEWFPGLLSHLHRFRALLEENVGLPFEHLYAITRGLYKLGFEAGLADDARLERWGYITGTVPMAKEALLGGALEEAAGEILGEISGTYEGPQSLGESVARYVELARSEAITVGADREEERARQLADMRAMWPPYLLHGEDEHRMWLVDFAASFAFLQRVVDELGVSHRSRTTGSSDHDADVRTSSFDREVAGLLERAPGAELALSGLRRDAGLPNVVVPLSSPGEEREIDVPVRLGRVLVAVQTWAREVDKGTEAGDYGALRRRWRSAKDKLARTDRRYATEILSDARGRDLLAREGIAYVLPVLCSPFAEPVASLEPGRWLRAPTNATAEGLAAAVPRVLTAPELETFLSNANARELEKICEDNGWSVWREP